MTNKTEVSLTIPNIEDLVCINCKVKYTDMINSTIKSLFHYQILTCRLIIYTLRCCIASPSINDVEDLIHVIVNKKFYLSGLLEKHLLDLEIQFEKPNPVDLKIYEACLKYTFTFKFAPYWNLVNKSYYLRGPDFLSYLSTDIDALQWNILFQDDGTKLEMIPLKTKLYRFALKSFKLDSTDSTIDLTSFQCPKVYVLPNLSEAKVISVSKTLSGSTSFHNYNDLRRHWKNMYSYRLPKSDQDILFYQVVFPINPKKQFTYPEMCILSRKPEFIIYDNKHQILSRFIKDLSANIRSVCGEIMKIGHLYPELDIKFSRNTLDAHKTQSNYELSERNILNKYENYSFICNLQKSQENLFEKYDSCKNRHELLDVSINRKISQGTKIQEFEEHDGSFNTSPSLNNKPKGQNNDNAIIKSQKNILSVNSPSCTTIIDRNIEDFFISNQKQFNQDSIEKLEFLNEIKDNINNIDSKDISKKRPIIKSVKKVYFNLANIKKNRITYNMNKIKTNIQQQLSQKESDENKKFNRNQEDNHNLSSEDSSNQVKNLSSKTQCDENKSENSDTKSLDEFQLILSKFNTHIQSNDELYEILNKCEKYSSENNLQKSQETLKKFANSKNYNKLIHESSIRKISQEIEIQGFDTHGSQNSSPSLINKLKNQKKNIISSFDTLASLHSSNKLENEFESNKNDCFNQASQLPFIHNANEVENKITLQESIQVSQNFKTCKKLSPISIFKSNENSKNNCLSENESMHCYTPDIFKSYTESQSKRLFQNFEPNNFSDCNKSTLNKDHSKFKSIDAIDFTNFLSFSSNELENTDTCKNYNEACEESKSFYSSV